MNNFVANAVIAQNKATSEAVASAVLNERVRMPLPSEMHSYAVVTAGLVFLALYRKNE